MKEKIVNSIEKHKQLYFILISIAIIVIIFIQKLMKSDKLLYNNNFVRNIALGMTISFIIVYSILYYIICIKKYALEKISFFAILFLGISYLILIPPYVVPDETAHLLTAYAYSNEILGIEKLPNHPKTIYMRADDANTLFTSELSIDMYNYVFSEVFHKASNTELIQTDIIFIPGNWHNYIISACGIALGRSLGLSTPLVYIIGRLFNLVLFAILMYYAIKKIPFGKSLLCIITLCPMVLQQAASYSYDAMINGVCFLAIAFTLFLVHEKDSIQKINVLILIFLLTLLSFDKGGVYIPICIWCLFFSRKLFNLKKNQIAYFIISVTCIVLFMIIKNSSYVMDSIRYTNEENIIIWANEPGYTMQYIISHLDRTIKVFFNTIFYRFPVYIYNMIGGLLGQLKIQIEIWVILFYCILIMALIFVHQDREEITEKIDNILGVVCSIGTIGMIMTGMLLSWTPLSYNVIEGIQGRYFLPILPLIVLILRKSKWRFSYNIDRPILIIGILLQYFVFIDIIQFVL